MARTLLELIQQATNEIGILQPSQLVGQVDDQSRQLLALANREGKDFAMLANSRGGWQNLHKEYTFTTVSGTPDYALPSDFEYFVQSTFWDGSMRWELIGHELHGISSARARAFLLLGGDVKELLSPAHSVELLRSEAVPLPKNMGPVRLAARAANQFFASSISFSSACFCSSSES